MSIGPLLSVPLCFYFSYLRNPIPLSKFLHTSLRFRSVYHIIMDLSFPSYLSAPPHPDEHTHIQSLCCPLFRSSHLFPFFFSTFICIHFTFVFTSLRCTTFDIHTSALRTLFNIFIPFSHIAASLLHTPYNLHRLHFTEPSFVE